MTQDTANLLAREQVDSYRESFKILARYVGPLDGKRAAIAGQTIADAYLLALTLLEDGRLRMTALEWQGNRQYQKGPHEPYCLWCNRWKRDNEHAQGCPFLWISRLQAAGLETNDA